jgi:hypothetical protein
METICKKGYGSLHDSRFSKRGRFFRQRAVFKPSILFRSCSPRLLSAFGPRKYSAVFICLSVFVSVSKGRLMKMYVGNLAWSVTKADLEALFATYGAVRSVEVIMDRETGRSRGFGFVEMDSQEAAQQAMQALNGNDFQGRNLTVNEARERSPRPGGGGGRGGYGGGGGRGGYGGGRGRD